MTTAPLSLRIFLASPGDLTSERTVVSQCIEEVNTRLRSDGFTPYEVVGWDRVRGTIRRPQEAIDELIAECHYMIVLLAERWGMPTGSPWGYTSGTEEELFTGLLQLGQCERPMRDIWIAFLDRASPDPHITNLRNQLEVHHLALFESISDIQVLKERLFQRLVDWQPVPEPKAPRYIDLITSSGADVLKASRLRQQGVDMISLGNTAAGISMLKDASDIGGPEEHLTLAQHLGRLGNYSEAIAASTKAVEWLTHHNQPLASPLVAEAFYLQADILRRQNKPFDAIGRLQEALSLLDGLTDPHARWVRCRILDSLGLAYKESGDLATARCYYDQSLNIRKPLNLISEIVQSQINLARLEEACGNLSKLAALADDVEHALTLNNLPATATRANAEAFLAETRLTQNQVDIATRHAIQAVALNRQIGHKRGEAISQLLLARCYRTQGLSKDANEHARICLELNGSIGDQYGINCAKEFLTQRNDVPFT